MSKRVTQREATQAALDLQAEILDTLGRHEEAEEVRKRVPLDERPEDHNLAEDLHAIRLSLHSIDVSLQTGICTAHGRFVCRFCG